MESILRENPVEAKKQIGFLPQKPPLYPDLTVDEYLTHCALMRLVNKHQVKKVVEEAKERCQIAHFSKKIDSKPFRWLSTTSWYCTSHRA